jgi:hypothetical protein
MVLLETQTELGRQMCGFQEQRFMSWAAASECLGNVLFGEGREVCWLCSDAAGVLKRTLN